MIQEMIRQQDVAEVRQFAKMLYNTSAFSEQDRGALMARVIRVFQDLRLLGKPGSAQEGTGRTGERENSGKPAQQENFPCGRRPS